jgi:hypothetical protein
MWLLYPNRYCWGALMCIYLYFLLYSNAAPLNPDQQLHLEVEQDFLATLSDYEKKEYSYFKNNVRFHLKARRMRVGSHATLVRCS